MIISIFFQDDLNPNSKVLFIARNSASPTLAMFFSVLAVRSGLGDFLCKIFPVVLKCSTHLTIVLRLETTLFLFL